MSGPFLAVCMMVVGMLVVLLCRKSLKQEIPSSAAVLLVAIAVLVAAGLLYRVYTKPPTLAEGDPGGAEMVGAPEGGMGSGGGMGGGPGGGMGGPSPHRDLGQLVRRLAVLQARDAAAFSPEQTARLVPILQALAAAEAMSADEAETREAQLEAVLTPEQAAAMDAIELPRPERGGPPGGAPGGGEGAGDRRAAMRTRLLEIPYVKGLYDAKVAEDPAFASDEERQGAFFRSLRGQISPFLQGASRDALQELLKGLTGAA